MEHVLAQTNTHSIRWIISFYDMHKCDMRQRQIILFFFEKNVYIIIRHFPLVCVVHRRASFNFCCCCDDISRVAFNITLIVVFFIDRCRCVYVYHIAFSQPVSQLANFTRMKFVFAFLLIQSMLVRVLNSKKKSTEKFNISLRCRIISAIFFSKWALYSFNHIYLAKHLKINTQ